MKKIIISIWLSLYVPLALIWANQPPARIVSLSPNITEIVFRLGGGDRLVGRTEYCLYPEAALKITTVGGYLNPDYEGIMALQPDLILMLPNPEMERRLQGLGLNTVSMADETVEDILGSISGIGEVLNLRNQAQRIIQGIRDTLQWVKQEVQGLPAVQGMLVVGREPGSLRGVYVAGKETYLSEIWVRCGGRNIFDDVPLRYFDASKEDILQRNPEIILEFHIIPPQRRAEQISRLQKDWQRLPLLKAVREDRIQVFGERYFLVPGPRITRIAMEFMDIVRKFHRVK